VTRCIIRSFILWASVLLLFGGCTVREYTASEPKLFTLKTKQLRFNDVGFIRRTGNAVQVELFSAGQAVERFEIDYNVCVIKGCLSKSAFNAEYLVESYPDNLMRNVLLGRPIFDGRGRVATPGGFEQYLEGTAYDIAYRVEPKQIYFKDRANRILIKIRDLPARQKPAEELRKREAENVKRKAEKRAEDVSPAFPAIPPGAEKNVKHVWP
jgi:hypothetical protein